MSVNETLISGVTVRTFTPDDYPAIVQTFNTLYPDHAETVEGMRHEDETADPKILWQRYMVEREGAVIGVGGYGQWNGMYHPQKFVLDVSVLDVPERDATEAALIDFLATQLAPHDPIQFMTIVREDNERLLRFWKERGYIELQREQESGIKLATFDPEPFAAELARVAEQGIVIKTLTQLKAETTDVDGLYHRLHDLHWQLDQDIPSPDQHTQVPHEEWIKRFDRPELLPDANFYALDGDQLIGTSILWRRLADEGILNTGLTGVRREYRKRGIATALKMHALTWAKNAGFTEVRTWNNEHNAGMLGINYRLGFEKLPAWYFLGKTLKESPIAEDETTNREESH